MARAGVFYREVLPFTAIFSVECTNVVLNTLFKEATNKGLNFLVFMSYSFGISTLALLPLAFLFHRKTQIPPLRISFVVRMIILGILGFTAQMCGFKGIEYTSPTLNSAMNNLIPAFTFALAVILRMEKLEIRRLSNQAKIIGTIVSISGAFVVIFYAGPVIIRTLLPSISLHAPSSSGQSNWIIGGSLFVAQDVLCSVWYILQTQTVKEYPAELLVVFFYDLSLTIVATSVCLIAERDFSVWKIKNTIGWAAILFAGIVGTALGTVVQIWGLNVKGPVYVALFKPLSIAVAAIMGVIFLGDALYLGSIIGAILISLGFYTVIWGKAQEAKVEDLEVSNQDLEVSNQEPLLQ